MAKVAVLHTASTELLASSSVKTYKVILTNMDNTNNVWVNIDATAVVDAGFLLKPNATIILDAEKGELGGVFNGIAETGTTNVSAYRVV